MHHIDKKLTWISLSITEGSQGLNLHLLHFFHLRRILHSAGDTVGLYTFVYCT